MRQPIFLVEILHELKSIYLSHMIKVTQLMFLLTLLYACNIDDNSERSEEPPSALFTAVPLNLEEGYALHPLTNDSIAPIVNSLGDTIITGKPIHVTPKETKVKKTENRAYLPLGDPEIIPIHPSQETSLASNVDERIIDRSFIHEININQKTSTEPFKNELGEIVLTGKPVVVTPTIKKAINTAKTPVEQPKIHDGSQFGIQSLDADQGLSSSYIYSIISDQFGQMYFGTYGNGIMIYDGHSIQSFTTREGLSSNYVRKLFSDSKGNIWIGSETGGLTKYDGKTFTHYSSSNGFLGKNVYDILEDKEGNIWCATNNGVSKFDGNKFFNYTESEGLSTNLTWALCEDSKGRIWIGSDAGVLSCLSGTKLSHYGEDLGILAGSILDITEDSEGNIWFSSMQNGIYRLSGNTLTLYGNDQGLAGKVITSINEDQQGDLWLTSFGNGIFQFDGHSFRKYIESQGLTTRNFWITHEDVAGNLWVGSEGAGVSIFQKKNFQHLITENGLKSPMVWALDKGTPNKLWFSNLGHGLVEMKEASLSYYGTEQNLSSNNILALYTDSEKNQWLGHWGGGVDCITDGHVTNFNSKNGLGSDNIFSITENSSGGIWFSTASGGAVKFDGESFLQLTEEQGLGKKNVRTIFEDSKGFVWIGTDGAGVAKYDGKTLTHYSEKEGLGSNFVRCIEEDKNGNLWIGTNLGGISIFTGKEFIQINKEHGLTNNNIRTIDRADNNQFIIGTEKGLNLVRMNKKPNGQFDIELSTIHKSNGLFGVDFLLNTSRVDQENTIWWATGKSLTSIPISELNIPKSVPRSLISTMEIDQNKFDFSIENDSILYSESPPFRNIPTSTTLRHSNDHLTFHFSGIDWKSSGDVVYSYRINDEQWSLPSQEPKADYRNLSPGKYTFEVRAMGSNFLWSPPDSVSFEILPPWWKTWWAYLLYFLIFAASVYFIYRYQLKRQLAMQEADRLREMDRLKTEFFTNISHEFRTPLTIITGLKDRLETNYQTRKDEAFQKNVDVLHKNGGQLLGLVNQLLDISKLEQGMVSLNIKEIDICSQIKYELSSYESSADQKKLQLELECAEQGLTILADEKVFLSIFHNLIGNALKFTIKGKITVSVKVKSDSEVSISIRDTGIGIAQADLPKIFDRFYQVDNSDTKEFQGSGIGLSHVQKLIELLGASIQVDSTLHVGTTFTLTFPKGEKINSLSDASSQLETSLTSAEPNIEEENDPRPKLLIVEDNNDMRYFISTILEDDYFITTATNGIEGLALAQKLVPDFIISDWMMPKMTGPEMLQKLKEDLSTSHIPMMLLTARADQESKIEGYEHGADAYLTKPFESKELRVRIKVLIEAKRRLQNFYSSVETKELEQNEARPKIEDTFILRTLEFVQKHLGDSDLTGDRIAEQHHLSRAQFARKLRTLTGKSVTEFIRKLRIKKAKHLLIQQELNVSEIAYEVGFSDPAYFTRVFTKETGIAPSSWNKDAN